MEYRKLGRSGLKVSKICLGTMTFGGRGFWSAIGGLDQSLADRIVGRALDAGDRLDARQQLIEEAAARAGH